ncbi:MAG: hypothetical protein IJ529_01820 [Alphaproteobacteria bacterium]|nr:hypothetical protein [Alphaproteobacteria bacterium]
MIESADFLLSVIMTVPLSGVIFASLSKETPESKGKNVCSVGIFCVIFNLLILWITAQKISLTGGGLQLTQRFEWLEMPKIELILGLDFFSLLLIAAVHFAVLLGLIGSYNTPYRLKTLVILALLFLSMITGYLMAADLFSFYIFFEAQLLPLFLLLGIFGAAKRPDILHRFFLFNLSGAVLLFMALMILFNYQTVSIADISRAALSHNVEIFVWAAIFIAFLSRIPIWPFHYWISSVNVNIRHPLVFIIANVLPLTGVYGLIRFFPLTAPDILDPYLLILETISIISMAVIALIGFENRDIQYKIFSYMTVYYILYLLGALLPTDALLTNIGFSMFAWLIITSAIVVIITRIEKEKQLKNLGDCGILNGSKRNSVALSFFILAAVGLPLSSLFLNNMLIFAGLLLYNLKMAIFILGAIILSSLALLGHLFYMKYPLKPNETKETLSDMPVSLFAVMGLTATLLIASFINPLWYME